MANVLNDDASAVQTTAKANYALWGDTLSGWQRDNFQVVRLCLVLGGFTPPGPGIGYGQIFPLKQDL